MQRWSWIGVAALVLGLLMGAEPAQAQTVYTFLGTGTGSLNGVAFSNKSFTVQAIGNNSTISDPNSSIRWITAPSATLSIDGFAPANFTGGVKLFRTTSGFSGLTNSGGANILALTDPALASWDIVSNVGPVYESVAANVNQWVNVGTSLGPTTFTSITNVTFSAGGSNPEAPAVPEPSSELLFLPALGVMALVKHRRSA